MTERHIRITRIWADVTTMLIVQPYIDKSERVMIFHHSPDSGAARDHIHMFAFGLDVKPDTIRETLRKYVPGRMDLSVKTKAGKKNDIEITDQGAYNYASRDGRIKPCYTKGYTEDELAQLHGAAEQLAKEKEDKRTSTIVYSVREVVKVDNVYNRLFEEAHAVPGCKTMTLVAWKKWIIFQYLKAGKPAPRTADSNRYAYSIYMNMRYNFDTIKDYTECDLPTDYA